MSTAGSPGPAEHDGALAAVEPRSGALARGGDSHGRVENRVLPPGVPACCIEDLDTGKVVAARLREHDRQHHIPWRSGMRRAYVSADRIWLVGAAAVSEQVSSHWLRGVRRPVSRRHNRKDSVQAVAAAARLREIRHAAYRDVRIFRNDGDARGSTRARRLVLEQIAGQLGDMELELSFSVEASADLGLLVPSLRAEGFHGALYESMGLADKAATAARMLQRLARAISAELTAIESIERRADEGRRFRWAVAVGFLSVVAVPAGLIFAFFAVNATQIHKNLSMFSSYYLPVYLAVFSLFVVGGLLLLVLYLRFRRAFRSIARSARTSWISPDIAIGGKAGEPARSPRSPPTTGMSGRLAATVQYSGEHVLGHAARARLEPGDR